MHAEILRTKNFFGDAVAIIQRAADVALFERGIFRIGLSGGSTPRGIYEVLADESCAWEDWFFTFGDERCVHPEDDGSNYRMVADALFKRCGIPERNVLRICGELEPVEAARDYERRLRAEVAEGDAIYRHDLLLLGVGDDGHTASLFPGTAALEEKERWVVENYVSRLDAWRVTLTYPVINAARQVIFLVRAKGKEEVLKRVEKGGCDDPCCRVHPVDGNLIWLVGEV